MKHIVFVIVAIVVVAYLINQCRKPHGWLARFFLWEMGDRHARVTDWGLSHVAIERHRVTLDVGCGGGRTISKLAAIVSEGKAYGIDYSAASVAAARRANKNRSAPATSRFVKALSRICHSRTVLSMSSLLSRLTTTGLIWLPT